MIQRRVECHVTQKRQKLDKFIDQLDEKTSTGRSSNDLMANVLQPVRLIMTSASVNFNSS
jgi:hypothetical protein